MISKKWWLIWMVVICADCVFSKQRIAAQLGCFKPSNTVLLKRYTKRPFGLKETGHGWCVAHCSNWKYTFAGIQLYKGRCGCGNMLKYSTRVPIKQCTSPCDKTTGRCGQRGRTIIYVLGAPPTDPDLVDDTGQRDKKGAPPTDPDLVGDTEQRDKKDEVQPRPAAKESAGISYQLPLGGGVVGAVVTLLAIIIHCARVSRKRSRLLKVYIAQLKRGETGATPPPSTFAISNELCLSFFCCCYGKQDDLEYDELLYDLDLEPTYRRSFNVKVNQYLNKCEAEKKENREELRKILRSLSKSSPVTKARSSIPRLAELYLKSRSEKHHSDSPADLSDQSQVSLRNTVSCPSRVDSRNRNSSASPNEKKFPYHSSRRSMYTRSSLRHGSRQTEPPTLQLGRSGQDVTADDDTLTSQSSIASRLLPLLCKTRTYSQSSPGKRHTQGSKTRRSRSPRVVRMKDEGLNSSESQSD